MGLGGNDDYAGTIHDGRLKFYCGRFLGSDAIPGSDGRCGPTAGPACASCSRFQASLVNDEGDVVAFGTSIGCQGTFYCGRRKGVSAIPGSDGRCGPDDGPACQSCCRLFEAFTNRRVPPYCYRAATPAPAAPAAGGSPLPTGGGPNVNLVANASLRVEVLRPGVPLSALSALDGDEEGANEV